MIVKEIINENIGRARKADVSERDWRSWRRVCLRGWRWRRRLSRMLLNDLLATLSSLARHVLVIDDVAFVEYNSTNAADETVSRRESVRCAVLSGYANCVDSDRWLRQVHDRLLVRVVSVEPAQQLLLFLF